VSTPAYLRYVVRRPCRVGRIVRSETSRATGCESLDLGPRKRRPPGPACATCNGIGRRALLSAPDGSVLALISARDLRGAADSESSRVRGAWGARVSLRLAGRRDRGVTVSGATFALTRRYQHGPHEHCDKGLCRSRLLGKPASVAWEAHGLPLNDAREQAGTGPSVTSLGPAGTAFAA